MERLSLMSNRNSGNSMSSFCYSSTKASFISEGWLGLSREKGKHLDQNSKLFSSSL